MSLNAGRYVGIAPGESDSDENFEEKLETLNEELELQTRIAQNIASLLSEQGGMP